MGKQKWQIAADAAIKKMFENNATSPINNIDDVFSIGQQRYDLMKQHLGEGDLYPVYQADTNNPLMLLRGERKLLPIYSQYSFVDPETNETVYIGEGTPERAFAWHKGRTNPHSMWCLRQLQKGYLQAAFIKINNDGLTKAEGVKAEKLAINKFQENNNGNKPKFNR